MNKRIGKDILLFVLLLLAGVALSAFAKWIDSDFFSNLAIVGPAGLIGYVFSRDSSKDSNQKMFNISPKEWLGFAAGVLIITTCFWLFEKFVL